MLPQKRTVFINKKYHDFLWNSSFLTRKMAPPESASSPTAQEGNPPEASDEMEAFKKAGKAFAQRGSTWLKLARTENPSLSKYVNELEDFLVDFEAKIMEEESYLEDEEVTDLIDKLQRTHFQLANSTTMAAASTPPPPTPSTQTTQQPAAKRVKFPPFSGFKDRFHSWQSQFQQFLDAERPAEEELVHWLKYELCPQLADEYQTQLQFLRTSKEFMVKLDELFGNSMAAIAAVKEKIANLPSCTNGKPEQVLKFFNTLQAIRSDLNHLDAVFPDETQSPSLGIICFCTMEHLKNKLSHETKMCLKKEVLRQGKYCSPIREFIILTGMAEDAKRMAHYELMSKQSVSVNQQQTSKEKGTNKSSVKSTKSTQHKTPPRKRTPSPPRHRRSPSPRRQSPTPDRQQKKIFPCLACDSTDHHIFKCPTLGKDEDLPRKLYRKKVCVRCLRSESRCQNPKNVCDGHFISTKTKKKYPTDCYKCEFDGKKVHHFVCGHKIAATDDVSAKKAM